MLKVFSILTDTPSQSLLSLIDSSINDVVIILAPFLNQSFFQMVDVTDPAAVDSLLQNVPDHVNSFTIFFASYLSSTLSILIRILSSSDNILFINAA